MEQLPEQWRRFIESIDWAAMVANGLRVIVILIIAWVALRLLRTALTRLEGRLASGGDPESVRRAGTLVGLLRQGVNILVWAVVGLTILREFGVEIAPILASAGVLGLAIGFGAQNLVRDIISGFFMILENQIRIGDVAILNGVGGTVEAIRFRTTALRDLHGTLHVFPNGTISTVANMTRDWGGYLLDIGVAYKEDVDHVIEVMKRVGRQLRDDPEYGPRILQDLEVFGVQDFADSAVIIRARLKTKPMDQWSTGREYRRLLKKAFDAEGIEIPFPHRSVYFGEASKPVAMTLLERSGPSGAERAAGEAADSGRQHKEG